ncbi:MAG: hypothetical protein KDA44_12365, partial [Planctomycetales bacterium]|nr:hypothetical protein [Planctomycetales bacterium]
MITSLCRFRLAGVALAAAVLGGVSTAAPAARAAEPMAVIAFSGYDALMEDIDFIGGLTGQMQASQQAEMMIGMFTQNKGLEGLDKTQPIGVVLQSNNGMPEPLICIPVTDSDALLEVAKQFGVTAEDMGDGIMQIQSPGMPLFGKPVGGWLLLSIAPTAFDGAPADLGGMLTELTDEYDLAAKVMVQNIPPAWRQQAIEMISQAADQSMTRLPEESDADYEARKVQLQQGLDEMKQAVDELDKLTIGLSIDGENAKVGFDVVMTAIPDSKLAKEMSKNNDATTNFAGFFEPDAAMMMTLSAAAAENDLAQLDQQLATLRKQAYSGIDDEGKISDSGKEQLKSAVDDLLDAVEATLRAVAVVAME